MNYLLEADSIIKSYKGRDMLTDCWLSCQTGEIVSLLGRNGCGKSTLLRIIFGTEPALNKSIRINGKVYESPFAKGNLIAYLPQHHFLPKNLSIKKIVALYFSRESDRQQILSHPLIKAHSHLHADQLSGGSRRFFEILLIASMDVRFVLLDEPFNGLEPLLVEEVIKLIMQLKPNKGFIITDHNFRTTIQTSDRIILIQNGVCRHIRDLQELERYEYVPNGTFSTDDDLGD